MPVGNKPSAWKDEETLRLAREFGLDNPQCFPRAWRSYRNKITTGDVCWLIIQTYQECPQCLELISLIFEARNLPYTEFCAEKSDFVEEWAYWQ